MNTIRNYIIVDDDPINNAICSMRIKRTLGDVSTAIFTLPEDGLNFIEEESMKTSMPVILFLDINMPTLSAWDFMEKFEQFSEDIKNKFTIYIVSSSIDQRDKDKADANKHIKGFISKPLDRDTILHLANTAVNLSQR